jgi:hypothetical protein
LGVVCGCTRLGVCVRAGVLAGAHATAPRLCVCARVCVCPLARRTQDVVYSEALVPILMRTIAAIATPKTTVLMANERRCEIVVGVFAREAASLFAVKPIPRKRQHPEYVHEVMDLFELRLKDPPAAVVE